MPIKAFIKWGYSMLFLIFCGQTKAQDLDFKSVQLDLTYFGNEITNPGAAINFDWSFLHSESRRNVVHRREAEITNIRHNALNLNINLCSFYQKPTHTLASGTAGLSFKRISGRLFVYEIGANVGYARTFLNSNYEFTESENDYKFVIPGAFYLNYHYYLNFGRYFRKPIILKGWTTGISALYLQNFNSKNIYLFNLKAGIILR